MVCTADLTHVWHSDRSHLSPILEYEATQEMWTTIRIPLSGGESAEQGGFNSWAQRGQFD